MTITQNPAPRPFASPRTRGRLRPALVAVPPAVFSATLRAALDRSDVERRQNAPCNDGRTGIVVDYSLGVE